MMRARLGVVAVVIGALAMAACGSSDSGDTASGGPKGDCPTAAVPVVVSVDQWGDIVDQLAGDCGDVTTIFKSSSADPHDYEPTPADTAKFTGAKLVVVNGLDYDPWADKAVDDARHEARRRERRQGRRPRTTATTRTSGTGPTYVYKVADAVTGRAEAARAEGRAATSTQRHDAWRASMAPYDAEIAKIKPAAAGKTYGATEGIFDYMADALGLDERDARGLPERRPPTSPIRRPATSTSSSRRSADGTMTC